MERGMIQFLISSGIFWLVQLPLIMVSIFIVPIMLLTKWDGTTTWFGNFKYGRGDTHYKAPSEGKYWKQVRFLCIRNPVSNFGKEVLSVSDSLGWPWLNDQHLFGSWYWLYGWKNPVEGKRTFVYRPWRHDES